MVAKSTLRPTSYEAPGTSGVSVCDDVSSVHSQSRQNAECPTRNAERQGTFVIERGHEH